MPGETGMRKSGATPHSIRMRGFYRAVKREERWALKIWKLKDIAPLQYLFALMYRNIDLEQWFSESDPILSVFFESLDIKKSVLYYPTIPVTYRTPDGQ